MIIFVVVTEGAVRLASLSTSTSSQPINFLLLKTPTSFKGKSGTRSNGASGKSLPGLLYLQPFHLLTSIATSRRDPERRIKHRECERRRGATANPWRPNSSFDGTRWR